MARECGYLQARIWWVWPSWLARQIVALEVIGSTPIYHPTDESARSIRAVLRAGESFIYIFNYIFIVTCPIMGCRQAVRQRILIPSSRWFDPSHPSQPKGLLLRLLCRPWQTEYDPLAQLAEHLTFNQGVRSSNLRWVTSKALLRKQKGLILFYGFFDQSAKRLTRII